MHDAERVGRLAFRPERDEMVAYFAPPGGMDGAVRLGSIAQVMWLVPALAQAFTHLMRDAAAMLVAIADPAVELVYGHSDPGDAHAAH